MSITSTSGTDVSTIARASTASPEEKLVAAQFQHSAQHLWQVFSIIDNEYAVRRLPDLIGVRSVAEFPAGRHEVVR